MKSYFIALPLLFTLAANAQRNNALVEARRFELIIAGFDNYVSDATTQAYGLTSNYSGRKNFGIRLGWEFLHLKRFNGELQTGIWRRDFGFKENNSHIPYWAVPLRLQLRYRLFRRISAAVYADVEAGRCDQSRYAYSKDGNTDYNLFLHRNDALLYAYGGSIGLAFGRWGLDLASEYLTQFDRYDRQYGRTIGSRGLGLELRYKIF